MLLRNCCSRLFKEHASHPVEEKKSRTPEEIVSAVIFRYLRRKAVLSRDYAGDVDTRGYEWIGSVYFDAAKNTWKMTCCSVKSNTPLNSRGEYSHCQFPITKENINRLSELAAPDVVPPELLSRHPKI